MISRTQSLTTQPVENPVSGSSEIAFPLDLIKLSWPSGVQEDHYLTRVPPALAHHAKNWRHSLGLKVIP